MLGIDRRCDTKGTLAGAAKGAKDLAVQGQRSMVRSTENSGETVAGRVQNLKPWPKGVSGNPGGRPKRDLASEIAQAVFENNPNAIYEAMLRALKKGDPRVFVVLADRAYGKVKEQVEVEFSGSLAEQIHAARMRLSEGEQHNNAEASPNLELAKDAE